jgi:hypothetical protein
VQHLRRPRDHPDPDHLLAGGVREAGRPGDGPQHVHDPGRRLPLVPARQPGLVSIPLSFLLGYLGTVLAKGDRPDPAKVAEMEVKSLTGADAAKALVH